MSSVDGGRFAADEAAEDPLFRAEQALLQLVVDAVSIGVATILVAAASRAIADRLELRPSAIGAHPARLSVGEAGAIPRGRPQRS
jgi:hypothetical protein